MFEKAQYIVVEGPIGAGKTSLARRLADRLKADLILEQPLRNPFLQRFYTDIERWALPTQLEFLFQRAELLTQVESARQAGRRVVSDFILDRDPLFASLTLSEDEVRLYEKIFAKLRPAPIRPDLVIYLQAQPEVLIERVRKRGQEAERKITEGYLEAVSARYASLFHAFDACPLFIVNAEVLNPVEEDDDFELIYQRLLAMRSYREYFSYA